MWEASFKKKDGDLTGLETVTLKLQQGSGQEAGVITIDEKTTDPLDLTECPPAIDGLVDDIKGSGVCVKNNKANKATYTYTVSLTAPYNQDQVYYYEFKGNKAVGEYKATAICVNGNPPKQAISLTENRGYFILSPEQAAEAKEFLVSVDVEKKAGVFDGGEELTLKLDTNEDFDGDTKSATAKIKDFDTACTTPGSITAVKEDAICKEGTKGEATFVFEVSVEPGLNKDQTYYYQFAGTDLTNADITSVLVNSEDKKGELDGSFVLGRDEAGGTVRTSPPTRS